MKTTVLNMPTRLTVRTVDSGIRICVLFIIIVIRNLSVTWNIRLLLCACQTYSDNVFFPVAAVRRTGCGTRTRVSMVINIVPCNRASQWTWPSVDMRWWTDKAAASGVFRYCPPKSVTRFAALFALFFIKLEQQQLLLGPK